MTYHGGCHCGAVRYEVRGELTEVLQCNCSMCDKKGILHWIVEQKDFTLLSGKDHLTDYQFNIGTAHHYFCKTCGIHSFYIPRSHPDSIDVNVRCLDGIDLSRLAVRPFDGRNWEKAAKQLLDA